MIRIGIMGYGNLARGVEYAVAQAPDMELAAVFTRRDPKSISIHAPNVPVCKDSDAPAWQKKIDVMILCGGSATDLPQMTPHYAKYFHVVDSFDTHANIPAHFAQVDNVAKNNRHTACICNGWDPGLFSLNRLIGECVLPHGNTYTFWGRGVSQGHSDAIRRIEGVLDARQYTIPVESAMKSVRRGENPVLTTRQKHTRQCYVVAAEGADLEEIRRQIVTMPNYFADYDTTVEFISQEELEANHSGLPHGGSVIRSGSTGWSNDDTQTMEFQLSLDSNPGFTGSILTACARAVYAMAQRKEFGCKTIFDIRPADLTWRSYDDILAHLL